jgi:hypothetical protein
MSRYERVCIRACRYVRLRVCMRARACVFVCVCVYVCVCVCVCVCVHMCVACGGMSCVHHRVMFLIVKVDVRDGDKITSGHGPEGH